MSIDEIRRRMDLKMRLPAEMRSAATEDCATLLREVDRLRAAIAKALDWCYRENIYGHVRNELEISDSAEHPSGEPTK